MPRIQTPLLAQVEQQHGALKTPDVTLGIILVSELWRLFRARNKRHTYASTLAQMGVDLLTISKLLGHADTRITSRHYAHLCDNTLKAAVAKLPGFGHQPDTKVQAIL